jgi:hypothetical protein
MQLFSSNEYSALLPYETSPIYIGCKTYDFKYFQQIMLKNHLLNSGHTGSPITLIVLE